MMGRTDVARYNNGAKGLVNVIPLIHGGVIRRPGLRYVATSKDSTKRCRLLKFTYNTDQSYIIELGNLYARFYDDAGAQIESSPGVPYEVVTPYTEAQIWQVDYCQGADTMFLFHPNIAPYRLQRFADNNWRMMLAPIDPEPFDELGILASMACTLSSAAVGSRTFTAASAVFLASDVGRQITSAAGIGIITGYTSTTVVTVNVTTAFPSTSLAANEWTIEGSPQTTCTPSAKDPVGATITLTLGAAGWRSSDVGRFVNINGGLCKITGFTSDTVVNAQIRTELAATVAAQANAWFLARSMWGGANGYPRTGSLYQQRLFVGGSIGFPQSVWFSELGNPYSFEIGADADMGYEMRLVSDQANPILNLASGRAVLALTSGSEFSLSGEGGITPATVTSINQSNYGSTDVTPCRLGNELLFVNRSGLKIRAMAADRFDANQYAAPDVTALAEHITESGVVEIDAQSDPESILWCVRNDGVMATCTLDRDNEVVAWARQITMGFFESVCIVPFGNSYSVWVVVRRVIDGVEVRYIERFDWRIAVDSALSGAVGSSSSSGPALAPAPPSGNVWFTVTDSIAGVGNAFLGNYDGSVWSPLPWDGNVFTPSNNITPYIDGDTITFFDSTNSFTAQKANLTIYTTDVLALGTSTFITGDGTYLYASGAAGYMQRKPIGSGSWSNISSSNFYSANPSITFMGGVIYACNNFTITATCVKSTDNGVSWSKVSDIDLALQYTQNSIANNGSRLVLLYAPGALDLKTGYSDDSGVTWTLATFTFVGSFAAGAQVYARSLNYHEGYFVAILSNGKTAYSVNGASWTAGANIPRNVKTIAYAVGKIVVGTAYDEMYVSTDHCVSWQLMTGPVGTGLSTENLRAFWIGDEPSGSGATGNPTDAWAGLDHLEGETVNVIADGILQTDKAVADGAITIDSPAVYVDVGLPYTSTVITLTPEIQGPTGSIQGKLMRAYEVALLVKDTVGATVNGNQVVFQSFGPTVLDLPIEPYTGWKDIPNFGYDTRSEITIQQTQPLPFHLLAVVRRIDVGEW